MSALPDNSTNAVTRKPLVLTKEFGLELGKLLGKNMRELVDRRVGPLEQVIAKQAERIDELEAGLREARSSFKHRAEKGLEYSRSLDKRLSKVELK